MAYAISSGLAIYFVLWWIVLFAVLPFGIQSQSDIGDSIPGTEPGAPIAPGMGRKLLWTTIIATIIYAVSMIAYQAGYFNVEWLMNLVGVPINKF